MDVVFGIILPVFGLLAVGFLATFVPAFDRAAERGLAVFVFWFALPVALFRSTSTTPPATLLEWRFLLAYFLAVFIVLALGIAIARIGLKTSLAESTILGFAGAYSNTVMLGIPLILTAFGQAGSVAIFALVALHSIVVFPTVTVLIEIDRGRGADLRRLPLTTLKSLVANPILMGLFLGVVAALFDLRLPRAVDTVAERLGAAAMPCALFALGASMRHFEIGSGLRLAGLPIAMKTVGLPLAVFATTRLLGVEPVSAAIAIVVAAIPTGVNPFLFAERYRAVPGPVAVGIVGTTLISCLTLTALLLLLTP